MATVHREIRVSVEDLLRVETEILCEKCKSRVTIQIAGLIDDQVISCPRCFDEAKERRVTLIDSELFKALKRAASGPRVTFRISVLEG